MVGRHSRHESQQPIKVEVGYVDADRTRVVNKWKHLIAHLATCEDEGVRVVAVAAVGRKNMDLDGRKSKSIYLNTQLGRQVVETGTFLWM